MIINPLSVSLLSLVTNGVRCPIPPLKFRRHIDTTRISFIGEHDSFSIINRGKLSKIPFKIMLL
jgi:hypothetical protein